MLKVQLETKKKPPKVMDIQNKAPKIHLGIIRILSVHP
jgi:hypothetical protein